MSHGLNCAWRLRRIRLLAVTRMQYAMTLQPSQLFRAGHHPVNNISIKRHDCLGNDKPSGNVAVHSTASERQGTKAPAASLRPS